VNHAAIALPAHLITLDPLSCSDGESFIGSSGRKGLSMELMRLRTAWGGTPPGDTMPEDAFAPW
jgi:hypothetical protein